VLDLLRATRTHPDIAIGASPRAGLALVRAASASAVASGRDHVLPDDVKLMAEPVLAHRLVLHPAAEVAGGRGGPTVVDILGRVPVPVVARR